MKEIKGDLIALARAQEFDLILHGCNCFCTMGAGIARQIKETFPQAYAADLATVSGDRAKLGTYSTAAIARNGHELVVVNAYTQFDYSGPGVLADYDAIERVFKAVARDFKGKRMGYPKIGAGLAGGNWTKISAIIDQALEGQTHTLVVYAPDRA